MPGGRKGRAVLWIRTVIEILFTGAWFSESGPLRELLIPILDRIIATHAARR